MSTTTTNFGFTKPDVASEPDKSQWGAQLNTTIDLIDAQLDTRTADYEFFGYKILNANVKSAYEVKYDFSGDISGGAVTINYQNGNYQYADISSDVAITFSNFPSGSVGSLTLRITQDGTGGRAVTFTDTYRTPGGGVLAPATTAGAVNKYRIEREGTGAPYDIFLNQNMKVPT